jgi:hypothetical protein
MTVEHGVMGVRRRRPTRPGTTLRATSRTSGWVCLGDEGSGHPDPIRCADGSGKPCCVVRRQGFEPRTR